MSSLRLSLSCGCYDRTIPILAGLVQPDGIDLDLPPLRPGSSMGSPDADVYELALPAFIIQRARTDRHIGVPVFPKRSFFQQLLMVHRDSSIERVEDLRGRNIGQIGWYQHTMGVWLRGYLSDNCSIKPEEQHWFTERPSLYDLDSKVGPSITVVPPEQRPLAQMLADGEIDALVHEKAHGILKVNPQLRRLLPDHRADEIAYFQATGCFPINHCLAIRSEIVSAHPWIVGSLVGAFEESKRIALAAMSGNNTVVSTPWMDDILEAQGRVLGDDPYAYGLEANRPQLERLVRYLYEQRLIPQPQAIEDLFADAAGGRPPGLRTSP